MSARRNRKRGRVRISGALISFVLHAGIILLLVKVLVFRAPKEERAIDVRVVEHHIQEQEHVEKEKPVEEQPAGEESMEAPAEVLPEETWTQDSMLESELDLSGLDAVANLESPLVLKGLMVGRSETARRKMLREFGGRYGSQAEKAVLKGLDWLQKNQREDGAWGVGNSRSMTAKQERARLTGLALLCYLAHGETAQSEKYGETVRRGIQYLLNEQNQKSGSFVPFSKTVGSHDDIGVYGHAISTYALCEAYAMTRMPMLKEPVEKAVKLIVDGQQKKGGWDHRYQHEKWSDLSVGGWQVQALRAAQAAAVSTPGIRAALKKSVPFVQGMHAGEGKFYYRLGNKTPNGDLDYMTGVAVLCMQLAGSNEVAEVKAGLEYLRDAECTDWDEGWEKTGRNKSFNIAYEWYYNTQAIFQKGGSKWQSWNNKFAPMLIKAQDDSGAWKPPSETDGALTKDIIYTTEFCCLSLQVYYRILPSFKKAVLKERPFEFENDVKITVR
ncbi:prenyltransferase/squalene oxidase repeat-containing protein [Pontiella agarivorans]|uniref:Terpene cyclase/mutase family protein n=1 Tax=Pontiella agarivorans TaxID=3038953 RepID=A0ABU5MUT2_9BACT|nr:prenyltransferase/squalene oxidase repeat-containing protein [Pontiella agarivorans]MDZ8117974.1 terpene cyclase/mutase family protein [Pontiella agarivorans]